MSSHGSGIPARLFDPEDTDGQRRLPEPKSIGYGHSFLTACVFPAGSLPPDTPVFIVERDSSSYFSIEAGYDPDSKTYLMPYGKYPRLVMTWISAQIRKAKAQGKATDTCDPDTRTVTIPNTNRLIREMGLKTGKNVSDGVHEAVYRLTRASIVFEHKDQERKQRSIARAPFAQRATIADPDDAGSFVKSDIQFSPEVFNLLATETMPYDRQAAGRLLSGRSVMPFDIYLWLADAMHGLAHPVPVSWTYLKKRFGRQTASMRKFRQSFRNALAKVLEAYPQADVRFMGEGAQEVLWLNPSPPPVPSRTARRAMRELEESGRRARAKRGKA